MRMSGDKQRMPKRTHKRPKDINRLAASIARETVKDALPPTETAEKDTRAAAPGRKGGRKGGKARAVKLNATKRSQTAKKAATARQRNRS